MPFSGVDEQRTCIDCKQPFTFTAGEQKFYDSKGFTDPPKRCPPCRAIKKAARQDREVQSAPSAPPPEDNYGNSWKEDGGRRRRRRGE